jgi:hypothetical protein
MTDHDANSIPILAGLIDQVVDGGLTPEQLRKAIGVLDRAEDGWKKCALAFVEAQTWAETFRHLDEGMPIIKSFRENPPRGASPRITMSLPTSAPFARSRRWIGDALAAGIAIVAFSLGWLAHGSRKWEGHEQSSKPSTVVMSTESPAEARAHAGNDLRPDSPDLDSQSEYPAGRIPTLREVARLRIGTGDPTAPEVPILTGPEIDERWLMEQPPPITEHGLAVWQRQGYQLDQSRRVVAVPLGDGRQAAVPIDQVQLRYVGRTPL